MTWQELNDAIYQQYEEDGMESEIFEYEVVYDQLSRGATQSGFTSLSRWRIDHDQRQVVLS